MSLLPRLCLMLALSGTISGCQTNPTAPGAADVTPNAVAGDAIEVTAFAAPPADPGGGADAVPPAASAPGAAPSPAPEPVAPVLAADPVTTEATTPTVTDSTEATTPEAGEAELAPPPPKSELQIACERRRGTWEDTGGGLKVCIRPTRDGGKRCTRESQCEGLCLARSGTCAPVQPLLGCHDILQDNGTRATQCIE